MPLRIQTALDVSPLPFSSSIHSPPPTGDNNKKGSCYLPQWIAVRIINQSMFVKCNENEMFPISAKYCYLCTNSLSPLAFHPTPIPSPHSIYIYHWYTENSKSRLRLPASGVGFLNKARSVMPSIFAAFL